MQGDFNINRVNCEFKKVCLANFKMSFLFTMHPTLKYKAMSTTWYPVIDQTKCTGCLTCFNKCKQGVYALDANDYPKVIYPEGCVTGCHGCGNLCPENAITYFGKAPEAKCCSQQKDEK